MLAIYSLSCIAAWECKIVYVWPGLVTYNTYLEVLSKTGNLRQAEYAFLEMQKRGILPVVNTYTIMINMYGKVSRLFTEFFDDKVAWSIFHFSFEVARVPTLLSLCLLFTSSSGGGKVLMLWSFPIETFDLWIYICESFWVCELVQCYFNSLHCFPCSILLYSKWVKVQLSNISLFCWHVLTLTPHPWGIVRLLSIHAVPFVGLYGGTWPQNGMILSGSQHREGRKFASKHAESPMSSQSLHLYSTYQRFCKGG